MKTLLTRLLACLILFGFASSGSAAITTYTNEASYLTALSGFSYATMFEGFEGTDWNNARYPNSVSSKTTQGLTWTANSYVTTYNFGIAPRTGNYGVFDTGTTSDRIIISSATTLTGVGGWFVGTNAENVFIDLDGSYSGATISGIHQILTHDFLGVIDTNGFTSCSIRTSSGNWFADDFTIATPIPIPGALWLLGSGLIGIVGIRKKFKK